MTEPYQSNEIIEEPKPWGFWATVGFSSIVAMTFLGLSIVVFFASLIFQIATHPDADIHVLIARIETSGFVLAIATCLSAPVCTALTILFATCRKNITLKDYLGLNSITLKQVFGWVAFTLAMMMCMDTITLLLDRPIVPDDMAATYATAYFAPLLWLAIVIMAPVFEEVFFRGFVFAGLRRSALGPAGAVFVTAVVWGALHVQYDFYGMTQIFVMGLILGCVRLKSNSLYPCILIHAFNNAGATLETVIKLNLN